MNSLIKSWIARGSLVLMFSVISAATARAQEQAPAPADESVQTTTPSGESGGETQEAAEPKKDTQAVLKPGIIASVGKQAGNAAVSVDSGGAVPGDEPLPIGASINRLKSDRCEVKITNTHEKNTYALSYSVEGVDARGGVSGRSTHSATVKPKQTVTNTVTCREGLTMQVTLRSGHKL